MDRRDFLRTGIAAGVIPATGLTATQQGRQFYELRIYELRSDIQPARIQAFFGEHLVPAMRSHGSGPVGVFAPEAGLPREALVVLASYPSFAAVQEVGARLQGDQDHLRAARAFEAGAGFPYVRYEARLMEAFSAHPRVEVPAIHAGRAPRLFEMRTYESRNAVTLATKIDQFNQGEIDIFRKSGMAPVFFGENRFAPRLPSLSYMVAFDDMAARQQAWATFRAHPEWLRMRDDPRWNVEGAVSTSHIVLMQPTAYSEIR